jgi:hypothetical protein
MKNLVNKAAYEWLLEMLPEETVKKFMGRYAVLIEGETLIGMGALDEGSHMSVPHMKRSCCWNGGCAIYNSGRGFSLLSCDDELFEKLHPHFEEKFSIVLAYNGCVTHDSLSKKVAKMELSCKNCREAQEWMASLLTPEQMQEFAGQWISISSGEVLHGVPPMFETTDEMEWVDREISCGWNGGAGIMNLGKGWSILTCNYSLYSLLRDQFSSHDAYVSGYNGVVWFDTDNKRIASMDEFCNTKI